MGNLSNPSINRWGLNLFWYKIWYSDKNYAPSLHQDHILTKLIEIYLMYGILLNNNMFIHKFWYYYKFFKTKNYYNEHNIKYYRLMNFKSVAMNINSSYTVRIKIKNIYIMKIWLLRYHNWIIINFYCFQPPKKKFNKQYTSTSMKKHLDFYLNKKRNNLVTIQRLKYAINYYTTCKYTSRTNFYSF
jgi:hypothetical protein